MSPASFNLGGMKTIEEWRWRVKWAGKWCSTSYHTTEESIRREHPEATKVPGSMRLMEVAETDAERVAAAFPRTVQRPMDPRIESAWKMRRRPE